MPGVLKYEAFLNTKEQSLVVTCIYPSSVMSLTYAAHVGFILTHVNDIPVKTLDDLRDAMQKSIDNEFVIMQFVDTYKGGTNKLQVALPIDRILDEEYQLAKQYERPITPTMKKLLEETVI